MMTTRWQVVEASQGRSPDLGLGRHAIDRGQMHYWLCSVRPNGRPHVVPRWGVFLDNKFYYDGSPETRHARNITENPYVTLNLENGEQAIIWKAFHNPRENPIPNSQSA